MFSSMISFEFSSMQEILANAIYLYDILNEFSNWMKYKRYPIVNWTQESRSYGKLSQNFKINHGKLWWIPTRLVFKSPISIKGIPPWLYWRSYILSSQEPCVDTFHDQEHWIMIDIRQAGKYV